MAYQSIWYFTDLPKDVVEILDKDLYDNFDNQMISLVIFIAKIPNICYFPDCL